MIHSVGGLRVRLGSVSNPLLTDYETLHLARFYWRSCLLQPKYGHVKFLVLVLIGCVENHMVNAGDLRALGGALGRSTCHENKNYTSHSGLCHCASKPC